MPTAFRNAHSLETPAPLGLTPKVLRQGTHRSKGLDYTLKRLLRLAPVMGITQISKSEILRKLKQGFGSKTVRDIRSRVG